MESQPDGLWSVEVVQPGTYKVEVVVFDMSSEAELPTKQALAEVEFEIAENSIAGTIDVGVIEVRPAPATPEQK